MENYPVQANDIFGILIDNYPVKQQILTSAQALAALLPRCGNNVNDIRRLLSLSYSKTQYGKHFIGTFSGFLDNYQGDADLLTEAIMLELDGVSKITWETGNLKNVLAKIDKPENQNYWIMREKTFEGYTENEAVGLLAQLPPDDLEYFFKDTGVSETLKQKILDCKDRFDEYNQKIVALYTITPAMTSKADYLLAVHDLTPDDFVKYLKRHYRSQRYDHPIREEFYPLVKPFMEHKDVIHFCFERIFTGKDMEFWSEHQYQFILELSELGEKKFNDFNQPAYERIKHKNFIINETKDILDAFEAIHTSLSPKVKQMEFNKKWIDRLLWGMGIWNPKHYTSCGDYREPVNVYDSSGRYKTEWRDVKAGTCGQISSVILQFPFVLPVALLVTVISIIPMLVAAVLYGYQCKLGNDVDKIMSVIPAAKQYEDMPRKIVKAYPHYSIFHDSLKNKADDNDSAVAASSSDVVKP